MKTDIRETVIRLLADRPVAYHPLLARSLSWKYARAKGYTPRRDGGISGGVYAALLLCQLLYWADKGKDEHGWIYKTETEFATETALSPDEQAAARRILSVTGAVEIERRGIPARLWYRVAREKLTALLAEYQSNVVQQIPVPPNTELVQPMAEQAPPKAELVQAMARSIDRESHSETTQKTTPESTDRERAQRPAKPQQPDSLSSAGGNEVDLSSFSDPEAIDLDANDRDRRIDRHPGTDNRSQSNRDPFCAAAAHTPRAAGKDRNTPAAPANLPAGAPADPTGGVPVLLAAPAAQRGPIAIATIDLSPAGAALAHVAGLDPAAELAAMKDWYISRGQESFASPEAAAAAWRRWVRQGVAYRACHPAGPRNPASAAPPAGMTLEEWTEAQATARDRRKTVAQVLREDNEERRAIYERAARDQDVAIETVIWRDRRARQQLAANCPPGDYLVPAEVEEKAFEEDLTLAEYVARETAHGKSLKDLIAAHRGRDWREVLKRIHEEQARRGQDDEAG